MVKNPQRISHIKIAILKSQAHNQAHFEIKICKKKNVNKPSAHIVPHKIGKSEKFISKHILNNIATHIAK
nr:hypothetical protein [Patescibacteria group bacterium]